MASPLFRVPDPLWSISWGTWLWLPHTLPLLVEINLIRTPPHILILILNYFRDSLNSNVQCRMTPLQLDELLGLVGDLAQPAGHLVEVLANLPASTRWWWWWWWWWWWQQSKFLISLFRRWMSADNCSPVPCSVQLLLIFDQAKTKIVRSNIKMR